LKSTLDSLKLSPEDFRKIWTNQTESSSSLLRALKQVTQALKPLKPQEEALNLNEQSCLLES
jgi:hypothetical protein